MRRSRWIIGICLTLGLIAATGPVALAGSPGRGVPAGGNRILRGKTSQGQKIMVVMNRIGGGWGLQELDFGALLRCQDGTRIGLEEGRSWFGPLHPTSGDQFDIDEVSTDEAFRFHGRIGPKSGSGTIEVTFPALTQDEQAQTCTSKERTWSVTRTSPSLNAPCCAPAVTGRVPVLSMTVRVGRDATRVVRSWEAGTATSHGSSRQTRLYAGSTSQDLPARFRTERFAENRRLTDMSFSFRIRCEDGSRYGLGTGWSFGRRGPRLDTSGGFGFDDVFLFEAFHVHGRLGAHAGSGTAEDTMPGLTQQEQAMLCTSKNRTWSAKRAATPVPVPGVPSPAVTVRTTTR